MIWQPFAFYILPNSSNPSKTAFSSLIRKLLILKLTSSFFFFMKIRTTLLIFSERRRKTFRYLANNHILVLFSYYFDSISRYSFVNDVTLAIICTNGIMYLHTRAIVLRSEK